MKDRTHGIFLQKVSEIHRQKTNTASFVRIWYWFITIFREVTHQNKCVYCRNTRVLTLEYLSFALDVKLQDGGRPWHLVRSRRLGLVWFMRKPPRLRGWHWARKKGNWMLASPFFLSLSLSLSLSETRPALLCGSRLLLKSWALARYHRPEPNDCLVISDATPPQHSLSPARPGLAICPPQSHTPRETINSTHLNLSDTFPSFIALRLDAFSRSCHPPTHPKKSLLVLLKLKNKCCIQTHHFSRWPYQLNKFTTSTFVTEY